MSFKVFDIDYDNNPGNSSTYQDQLASIRGIALDGSVVIPSITGSADNTVSNPGTLNQVVTGTASANDGTTAGNVTISFGNTPIKSFSFTYGSGSQFAQPTYQHMGLYNIDYTPVPEINPAWFGGLSCFIVGLLIRSHHGRQRK